MGTDRDAAYAHALAHKAEKAIAESLQQFVGKNATPMQQTLMEDTVCATLDDLSKKNELQSMMADTNWFKRMRETLAKKIRGEDFTEDEFRSVSNLLKGIQTLTDISTEQRGQYRTLLHRMKNGEEFIFMDTNVMETLREELSSMQVSSARMKVTSIETDGNQIRAELSIEPTSPAHYITITVTADHPLVDQVVGNSVIPHEVQQEALNKQLNAVVHEIADVIEQQTDKAQYERASKTMKDMMFKWPALPIESIELPDKPDQLAFKAYESVHVHSGSTAASKRLAKVMVSE